MYDTRVHPRSPLFLSLAIVHRLQRVAVREEKPNKAKRRGNTFQFRPATHVPRTSVHGLSFRFIFHIAINGPRDSVHRSQRGYVRSRARVSWSLEHRSALPRISLQDDLTPALPTPPRRLTRFLLRYRFTCRSMIDDTPVINSRYRVVNLAEGAACLLLLFECHVRLVYVH